MLPPIAVRSVLFPWQMEESDAVALAVTAGLTVTVLVACDEHPFDVPVTV